jgi:hypothetical protein
LTFQQISTNFKQDISKKGLSFISNRQRRKEGTFCCVGVGGDRTHASRPGGAGYARLSQLICISTLVISKILKSFISTYFNFNVFNHFQFNVFSTLFQPFSGLKYVEIRKQIQLFSTIF